jgi:bacteriocin biosynthesis cyclodehydratase domain-containing protein
LLSLQLLLLLHELMHRRPQLAPWYRVVALEDALVLEHAQAVVRLDGAAATKLLPRLLPLLDGTRTVDEVVASLGERIRPAVEHALALLDEHRLLVEGAPASDGDDSAARLLAAAARRSEAELAERLAVASVAVLGSGRAAAEVARALHGAGIGHVVRGEWTAAPSGDLAVAAPAGDEVSRLREWNRVALAAQLPWLQLLPFDGRFAAIGPLFLPRETCCHACYRLRRWANVAFPDEFEAVEAAPVAASTPAPLHGVVAGLGALVAARWLALADPVLPGKLFALELRQGPAISAHHVYRAPRCPDCAVVSAHPLPWFKEAHALAG